MHVDKSEDKDVQMREKTTKRDYTVYADHDKVGFFKLMFEKALSAKTASTKMGAT
ncbi:hypothetical protein DFQ30_005101, partial [Apophysomyces sp. BC1015]